MNVKVVVKTDQTGANRPIDIVTNRIFNFQAGQDLDFWRAEFVIKKGSQSTDGVTATIYEDFDAAGNNLGNIFISVSSISQSFTNEIFDFSLSGITLTVAQTNYSLVLTTNTAVGGNTQIFIKDGNTVLLDADTGDQIATFDPDTGEQLSGEGPPPAEPPPAAITDTGNAEPFHPCIQFQVDLQVPAAPCMGQGRTDDFTNQRTLELPDMLGNGPSRLLKHGDIFIVKGQTANILKKNYATGSFAVLHVLSENC